MRKKLLGALMGFASGLYVASALFNTILSRNSFATDLDKGAGIFVGLIIIAALSFFGVYCTSYSDHSTKMGKD